MSLTDLRDRFHTGIESLDYEHRRLVDAMEALCEGFDRAGTSDELAALFGELQAKASAHFALEERLMRESDYPAYDTHKADHERLLERIRVMMEAWEAGLCRDCGVTLRDCLEGWLAGHVAEADRGLRQLAE